jgi:hypothetical protein
MTRKGNLPTALLVAALFLMSMAGSAGSFAQDDGEPAAGGLSAKDILDRVDDLYRGESAQGSMTMTISTEHWSRALSLEFWTRGREHSLFRIQAPKKEKGTATLRVENDLWNYLPKVKRVIKLPSSMMSASWMGSHFTNNDLVKESRMADDYTFEKTFEGDRDGASIVEITCHPKPDAAVVWGKVVAVVQSDDYIPVEILYYDEEMELARTMSFDDVKEMGGRTIPARMAVVPADKPNESTVMEYHEIEFELELGDDIFSLRNLQR